MLRYPCLVLDHDDTVVQSEATVNYPFFVEYLKEYRPGATITQHEYISSCFNPGYIEMCRRHFGFTDEELLHEYNAWKEHIRTHIPAPYDGIERIIRRQKEEGGLVCVVTLSPAHDILRDYEEHFDMVPDDLYDHDMPSHMRKPNPYPLEQIMKKFDLKPEEILVVDDLKLAWMMARPLGVPVAYAAWSKIDFPDLTAEMREICDYSFDSTEELEKFLFE